MPRPIILSTWSFGRRGNDAAWPGLAAGGSSLDAVEQAARAVEDDPEVDSVGYGGLPDRDGRMTLDGAIMRSPRESGAVVCIETHRHPVTLARLVMEHTEHAMLVGRAADAFADDHGVSPEPLLSDEAREVWERWQRTGETVAQWDGHAPRVRPVDGGDGGGRLFDHGGPDRDEARWAGHDTIGVLALDVGGVLAGSCSTSGTPFKLPGRVGDSPIIGHGLYVDPEHGAAVATGEGELISGVCGAFLAVELMRRGAMPVEAVTEALRRIADTYEILDHHQVGINVMRPDGAWSAGALRDGYRVAVTTAERSEIRLPDVTAM